MNAMTQRFRGIGQLLGSLFQGKRDLYTIYGYTAEPSYAQMVHKYLRQDVAKRINDTEPKAIWSQPPTLGKDVPAAFTAAWDEFTANYNLYPTLYRADRLAGFGRYAVVLLGFDDISVNLEPGTSTPEFSEALMQPVRPGAKLLYMQPYSEDSAEITELVRDPRDPRFGQPLTYSLQNGAEDYGLDSIGSGMKSVSLSNPQNSLKVHHSRILHIAENTLDNTFYGTPRLLHVYNILDDLQKVVGGSAEVYWLNARMGLHINVDKDMDFTAEAADDLSDEVDEYMHELRRVIRTKGVDVSSLGADHTDPKGTFGVLIATLSAATGFPQRILLGAEAGQLASAQDRANWAVRVEERRTLFAEPNVLNPLALHLSDLKVLPPITREQLSWQWEDAFIQNPLERAQTSAQRARSLANVAKTLDASNPTITPSEGRKIIGVEEFGIDPDDVPTNQPLPNTPTPTDQTPPSNGG